MQEKVWRTKYLLRRSRLSKLSHRSSLVSPQRINKWWRAQLIRVEAVKRSEWKEKSISINRNGYNS